MTGEALKKDTVLEEIRREVVFTYTIDGKELTMKSVSANDKSHQKKETSILREYIPDFYFEKNITYSMGIYMINDGNYLLQRYNNPLLYCNKGKN